MDGHALAYPLDRLAYSVGDIDVSGYPVYDWNNDDGYHKIGDWVEASAAGAGRKELGPPNHRSTTRGSCGRRC